MPMYLVPLNYTLIMIRIINFLFYMSYHNNTFLKESKKCHCKDPVEKKT